MASIARSRQLSAGSGVSGGTWRLVLMSPTGIAQVKSLYVRNGGATTAGFDLYLRPQFSGSLVTMRLGQLAPGAWERIDYWIVMEGGDELLADIGGPGISWVISGAILEGEFDGLPVPVTIGTLPAP